jgi:hypothetical protein
MKHVRFVRQRYPHGDCGIATLGTLAGVTYEDALAAVVRYQPAALQTGLTWGQMKRAATRLGVGTRIIRKYDIGTATGILNVVDKKDEEHFVFLWEGRIVDGDGEGFKHPSDYLRLYGYKAKWLMTRKED